MPTINSGSNSLTTPTSTSGSYIGYKLLNNIGGNPSITYFQRVYSVGSNQWCYYISVGSTNPSPASTATSPNWVGSFSTFQVLGSK